MPTYEYECDACEHRFELFQSIMADPETKCPSCKKKKLRRLMGTGAAVVFKGSGFYQTDYRSDSYKKSAEADSKSKSGGSDGTSSAGTTESKSSDSSTSAKPAESKPAASSDTAPKRKGKPKE
jgi:putative FmdB family regulatory protein